MDIPLHHLVDQDDRVSGIAKQVPPSNYAAEMIARIDWQMRDLPEFDPALTNLYALLALTKGTATTLEDVHDAWSIWTATTRGTHKSLIPFAELAPEVQELDREYVDSIHRAARSVVT